MNSPPRPSIRVTCSQCGGRVKLPSFQPGQKYQCPRCGAEIATSVESRAKTPESGGEASNAPAAVPDAEPPPLLAPGASPDSEEFGITCHVCHTRLHVHPMQIGTTITCPDCYSPVVVKAPSKRSLPPQAATAARAWADASGAPPAVLEGDAQQRLEKVQAELEREEAEERENSAERFTEGLTAFFADSRAWIRLGVLAICFELAMALFRYVMGIRVSKDAPAFLAHAASLAGTLMMVLLLIGFAAASAACGLALIKGTSAGLQKIERWPGIQVLAWGSEVFRVVHAAVLAALPGIALGIALGYLGITGIILFAGAASFWLLFPPILLSMIESNSAFAPFSRDVWNDMGYHAAPWQLAYLITSLIVIGGLFAFVLSLVGGFFLGLVGALAMVALMMLYFRTIGRLFWILGGRGG